MVMSSPETSRRILSALQLAAWDVLEHLSPEDRHAVLERLTSVVESEVARERERAVVICRGRAELWRTTELAKSPMASAQTEARARSNEAHYLADLLAAEEEGTAEADA